MSPLRGPKSASSSSASFEPAALDTCLHRGYYRGVKQITPENPDTSAPFVDLSDAEVQAHARLKRTNWLLGASLAAAKACAIVGVIVFLAHHSIAGASLFLIDGMLLTMIVVMAYKRMTLTASQPYKDLSDVS